MLSGKTIVIGISGGIAVYKICEVVSRLKKLNAKVHVIMTKAATQFVSPLSFQSLSNNYVITDMFEPPKSWDIEHIALAKSADLFLVAPATANVIGKITNGIADDMLTTTVMATKAKVLIAPAMNTNMYTNPIVQSNINKLSKLNYGFIQPETGRLACGDMGIGKLAAPKIIIDEIIKHLSHNNDFKGRTVLVTAGPTREAIDPVRYITNHSSGKMGYAIAKAAVLRGADVTLISGKTNIQCPNGVKKYIEIESAQDMYDHVMEQYQFNDIIIMSAAVADYRPINKSKHKLKKDEDNLILQLERTKDILKVIGNNKGNRIVVGFAAETQDLEDNAKKKIFKKNLDIIVGNDILKEGAGFGTDTNIVKIIDNNGTVTNYPMLNKSEISHILLDHIKTIINNT